LDYTIIHPGGLLPNYNSNEKAPGRIRNLIVGTDDDMYDLHKSKTVVPREDVARVTVDCVGLREGVGKNFDLISTFDKEIGYGPDVPTKVILMEGFVGKSVDYSKPNLEEHVPITKEEEDTWFGKLV